MPTERAPTDPASTRVVVRFVLLFLALVVAGNFFLEGAWAWELFRQDYGLWLARLTGGCLDPFVAGVHVRDDLVVSRGLSVRIVRHCDGLDAMSMLAAAILVFPASWKARMVGVLVGMPAMFVLNILRILILYFIGLQSRWLFDLLHVYAFQVSIIAFAAAGFIGWARSSTVGRLADRFGSSAAA